MKKKGTFLKQYLILNIEVFLHKIDNKKKISHVLSNNKSSKISMTGVKQIVERVMEYTTLITIKKKRVIGN